MEEVEKEKGCSQTEWLKTWITHTFPEIVNRQPYFETKDTNLESLLCYTITAKTNFIGVNYKC